MEHFTKAFFRDTDKEQIGAPGVDVVTDELTKLGKYVFEVVDTVRTDHLRRVGFNGRQLGGDRLKGAGSVGVISVDGSSMAAVLGMAANMFSVKKLGRYLIPLIVDVLVAEASDEREKDIQLVAPLHQSGAEADVFKVGTEAFKRGHNVSTKEIDRLVRFEFTGVVQILAYICGSELADWAQGSSQGRAFVRVVEAIELAVGIVTYQSS